MHKKDLIPLVYAAIVDRTLGSGERSRRLGFLLLTGTGCALLLLVGLIGLIAMLLSAVGAPTTVALAGVTAIAGRKLSRHALGVRQSRTTRRLR